MLGLLDEDLQFHLRRSPLPQPASGEILVKIDCCTLCKSDLHTASGKRKEPLPSVLGHEVVGTVEAIGSEPVYDVFGNQVKEGDSLLWSVYAAPNGKEVGWKDREQKSPGIRKYGHLPFDPQHPFNGGLASHIILFSHTPIAIVPHKIPVEILAPVNCSLATMVGAFRLAGDLSSKRVAIIGAGMLGIQGAAYAAKKDCEEILLVDIDPNRGEWAMNFGANRFRTPEELEEWDSFDIVIETSGSVSGMENSLRLASLGANIVWVGAVFPQKEIGINPERLIRKLHSLKGLHNYSIGDFQEAAQHMIRYHQDFPYQDLVGATFKLEEVQSAFDYAYEKHIYRVAVKP